MLSLLPKELLLELLEYIEPHHRPLLRTADARLAGILPTPDYDLLLREACHDGHLSMVQECVQNGSKPTDLDLTSLIKRNHHEAWWWVFGATWSAVCVAPTSWSASACGTGWTTPSWMRWNGEGWLITVGYMSRSHRR